MKKALFAIIAISLAFSTSCHTITEEEKAQVYIMEGSRKSGEQATETYLAALEEVETPSIYYNLAYSYLEAGEYDKAAETAEKAEELYPEYLRFSYLKAYAYRAEGRIWSYEKTLRDIIDRDPGNITIRDMLLEHYITTGRKQDAAALAEETLPYDHADGLALRALAGNSAFFASIAPEENEEEKKERIWTEPPFIYMPLSLLNGEADLTLL